MNPTSHVTLRWPLVIGGALVLLALGAGLAFVAMRPAPAALRTAAPSVAPASSTPTSSSGAAPAATTNSVNGARREASITLTPDAMKRAGIVVAPVTSGSGTALLRLPGVVEPNAYKQVIVTPIVGGRVTRVLVELGQSVRRGQPLAEIFSPDLAEAETRFVSARAELEAHERELQRTQKLADIGAASRQELEMLHAAHTAKL